MNSVDNHLADAASGVVSREESMAENNLKSKQLNDVQDALVKIEEGTYGKCEDTGKDIPFERLKALPYAKRTVEAEQAHQETNRVDLNDRGSTSRLQKPADGMQDSKSFTLEEIEESHNDRSTPGEEFSKNEETPKGDEK